MKLRDIIGGFKMPLNNEENELYEKLDNTTLQFDELSDRHKQVVFEMYKKRIVDIDDDGIISRVEPSLSSVLLK